MAEKLVYDTETRDLCNLVQKRTSDAAISVLQLARNDAQRFVIAQTALAGALGTAAASYKAWQGLPMADELELAQTILGLMKASRANVD